MIRTPVLLSFLLTGSLPAQEPTSPPPAEIVARYVAARGGLERIESVRSLILRGPPRPDGRPGRFMARARPFYFLVGEPGTEPSFAEGFDGASWEYWVDPGLVLRTSGPPSEASHHTAYFDDPLVNSLRPGWSLESLGGESIGGRPAWRLRATFPDGFQNEVFVDTETGLVVAYRKAAPVHAQGDPIETETRVSDWRELNGALFPMRFDEYVIATGELLEDMSGGWATAEVNVSLPPGYFSPPPEPDDPLARMLNAAYRARSFPHEALRWYESFRADPATAGIETEVGLAALGWQCVKNGAPEAGLLLLEANLAHHPDSAEAHFGLGRAHRAVGREADAVAKFREALAIDPENARAAVALEGKRP